MLHLCFDDSLLVGMIIPYLNFEDLEYLSASCFAFATGLVRYVYFQRAVVVIPERSMNPQGLVATINGLSPFTRHVTLSDPHRLPALRRLPALEALRIESHDDTRVARWRNDDSLQIGSFTRLTTLDMDVWIEDVGVLVQGLPSLRYLRLVMRHAQRDQAALSQIHGLEALDLEGTGLQNPGYVVNLRNLRSLRLCSWSVSDLTGLAVLTKLESLNLMGCYILDLSPISELPRLHELIIEQTPVVDLSPLARLLQLQCLNAARTNVTDLRPLASLAPTLEYLDLTECRITNVLGLGMLYRLDTLVLQGTAWPRTGNMPDVSQVLTRLSSLSRLHMQLQYRAPHNFIPSIVVTMHHLFQLQQLRHLEISLSGLDTTDIDQAGTLSHLTSLRVDWGNAELPDVPLWAVTHPHMTTLHLECVRFRHVGNLQYATRLQHLRLIDVVMPNIAPFATLCNLEQLEMTCALIHAQDDRDHAPVYNLAPLRGLRKLMHLDLSYTNLHDVAPLQQLHALRYLDLSWTNTRDISALAPLRQLQHLRLFETEINAFPEDDAFCHTLREVVLPEHINCAVIRQNAPHLHKLWHPTHNCIWVGHDNE